MSHVSLMQQAQGRNAGKTISHTNAAYGTMFAPCFQNGDLSHQNNNDNNDKTYSKLKIFIQRKTSSIMSRFTLRSYNGIQYTVKTKC